MPVPELTPLRSADGARLSTPPAALSGIFSMAITVRAATELNSGVVRLSVPAAGIRHSGRPAQVPSGSDRTLRLMISPRTLWRWTVYRSSTGTS
jgi:hypothetical protein